jgi:hypothetical protein
VDGMSSGCPLALHAAAEGLVIPKLALFEPPIQGNETPTGESDFTRELAALVTAGRRREAVERQWLLLALQIGWFPRRTGKPLLSSRQRRRRRMSRGWREKLPTS